MSSDNLKKDFVGSLEKGLKVICAFDEDHSELTLTDVANLTDMTRATARRFLKTLEVLGYVSSNGKLFSLTPKILELGFAYLTSKPIVNIVEPFIKRVSKLTGESCSVSVLDDTDVVYIARHAVNHVMSVNLYIGSRLPVWNTSMGRVLLAHKSTDEIQKLLEQEVNNNQLTPIASLSELISELINVKSQGYCIVDQELEKGLISIAVPLKNNRGEVVAAMNIGAVSTRMSDSVKQREVVDILQKAAGEIQTLLP